MPDPTSLKRDLDALRIHRAPPPASTAVSAPSGGGGGGEGFVAPAAARRVRRGGRGLVTFAALVLLAAAAVFLWTRFGSGRLFPPPEVPVARVVARDDSGRVVILTMAGYVVADRKATVGPQIPGRLMELTVDEGDTVEEGQVLARLNDAWYVAQANSVRAKLESARREAVRAKTLAEKGVGQLDAAERAESEADSLAADYEKAKEELGFTVIRAPISGRVIRRDADIGELVTPGGGPGMIKTAILSLVDPATFEVEVDVNETDIAKVALGLRGDVTLDAYPAKKYPGVVRKIAPLANRQKGTIQVKVRLESVDEDVRPEMSARVALFDGGSGGAVAGEGDGRPRRKRLFVPTDALLGDESGRFVFVLDEEHRARRRAVTTAGRAEGLVEIVSGLAEGEEVVVSGHDRFRDGDEVRVAGR